MARTVSHKYLLITAGAMVLPSRPTGFNFRWKFYEPESIFEISELVQSYIALCCEQCMNLQNYLAEVHKVLRPNALATLHRYLAERRGIACRGAFEFINCAGVTNKYGN